MVKLRVEAILEFDEESMYDRDDPEEVQWFMDILFGDGIYLAEDGRGELGDIIGNIKILEIERIKPE